MIGFLSGSQPKTRPFTFSSFLPVTHFSSKGYSLDESSGENLFNINCSGCHVNGGNIIRRSKTLRIKDLHRNGLDNPEAIAEIARNGIGIMTGYNEFLSEGKDIVVANWIWEKSQNAWVHG